MILFDTSIWIDAFKGHSTLAVELLKEKTAINEVVLIPVIIQEILQGIKHDTQFEAVKENLGGFVIIEGNCVEMAIGAASLYRNLRKKGITIRKPNDCLIAYTAIFYNLPLVHKDSDFELIARQSNLKILDF